MKKKVERRHLLMGLTAVGCTSGQQAPPRTADSESAESESAEPSEPADAQAAPADSEAVTQTASSEIPRRAFGATGEQVSALGLGGFHLGKPGEREAIQIMHRAIDEGITFFDNCWDYHDGESERRMGKALSGGKRDQVFLMTKIDGRNKQAAAEQIDASLERLQTDRVDLMQIHEVIREKDASWVFGEDGAIAALLEAQRAGKIRYIGFTGHKSPAIHLKMLEEAEKNDFHYDAVQMPLNVLDPHYDSFQKLVLPVLQEKGIAVLGMKPLASGAALNTNVEPEMCLRYALSLPTSVVITGCDSLKILDQAVRVGQGFAPLSEQEQVALLERTRPYGKDGHLEGFKVSDRFDATLRNEHWLTTGNL